MDEQGRPLSPELAQEQHEAGEPSARLVKAVSEAQISGTSRISEGYPAQNAPPVRLTGPSSL